MKRFLMLVGVAVVAAAMYVAAAPGSQQASGPTAKQFKVLKAQVASLKKTLKTVKTEADTTYDVAVCIAGPGAGIVPINQFGDTSNGFVFGPPDNTSAKTVRTALDVDPSNTPGALLVAVDPTCVTPNGAPHSGSSHLLLRTMRIR
jgi:hypothetical protein